MASFEHVNTEDITRLETTYGVLTAAPVLVAVEFGGHFCRRIRGNRAGQPREAGQIQFIVEDSSILSVRLRASINPP